MKKSTMAGTAVIVTKGIDSGVQVAKLLSRLGIGLSKTIPAAFRVGCYVASKVTIPVYTGVKVVQGGHYLIKNRKRIISEGLGSVVKYDLGKNFKEHPFKTIFDILM